MEHKVSVKVSDYWQTSDKPITSYSQWEVHNLRINSQLHESQAQVHFILQYIMSNAVYAILFVNEKL